MRKAIIAIIFVVAVGIAFASNDAWKTKPYQQWNSNDVKEVLTNSPWVRKTAVIATWKKGSLAMPEGGQGTPGQGQAQGQGQPAQHPGTMGGTNGGYGGGNTRSGDQSPQMPEQAEATFFVGWSSSKTMREAIARNAFLNNQFSAAQVEQYVNQEPPTYAVMVYAPDMTPFMNETEDALKSAAYLEAKQSKEKVTPSDVKTLKNLKDGKIESVEFFFPKKGPNGQPLVAANDKQAQFDCKLKMARIDVHFDLRKMAGKNGEDL